MTDVQSFIAAPIPAGASRALRALWHAARGDWKAAHEEAQEGDDRHSHWVHALLHREEGDQANAEYWCRRAGRPVSKESLADEREAMIATLLRS